jgi:hypothetical protein
MQVHNRLNDSQPQSGPVNPGNSGLRSARIRDKELIEAAARQPRPSVCHAQAHAVNSPRQRHIDSGGRIAVLAGIGNEVDQHLADASAIRWHPQIVETIDDAQGLVTLAQQLIDHRLYFAQELNQVERTRIDLHATLGESRGVQHILDQALEPDRAAMHRLDNSVEIVSAERVEIVEQKLRSGCQRSDRRA